SLSEERKLIELLRTFSSSELGFIRIGSIVSSSNNVHIQNPTDLTPKSFVSLGQTRSNSFASIWPERTSCRSLTPIFLAALSIIGIVAPGIQSMLSELWRALSSRRHQHRECPLPSSSRQRQRDQLFCQFHAPGSAGNNLCIGHLVHRQQYRREA